MSDQEFGELSPRAFCLLLDRREEERRQDDFRIAQLCSLVANAVWAEPGKTFPPAMFMPGYEEKPQTPEDHFRIMREVMENMKARNG